MRIRRTIWSLVVLAVWAGAGGLAARGEEMTITTYYPSPRGVYDELQANTITLPDKTTGQRYTLTMNAGRLLLTDVAGERAFILLELPEEE